MRLNRRQRVSTVVEAMAHNGRSSAAQGGMSCL